MLFSIWGWIQTTETWGFDRLLILTEKKKEMHTYTLNKFRKQVALWTHCWAHLEGILYQVFPLGPPTSSAITTLGRIISVECLALALLFSC